MCERDEAVAVGLRWFIAADDQSRCQGDQVGVEMMSKNFSAGLPTPIVSVVNIEPDIIISATMGPSGENNSVSDDGMCEPAFTEEYRYAFSQDLKGMPPTIPPMGYDIRLASKGCRSGYNSRLDTLLDVISSYWIALELLSYLD